jgi:hypothetical protein
VFTSAQGRSGVQVLDAPEDRAYAERDPLRTAFVELKEETIVGAMSIYREEVRPFKEGRSS